jgi:hypothetical protein
MTRTIVALQYLNSVKMLHEGTFFCVSVFTCRTRRMRKTVGQQDPRHSNSAEVDLTPLWCTFGGPRRLCPKVPSYTGVVISISISSSEVADLGA